MCTLLHTTISPLQLGWLLLQLVLLALVSVVCLHQRKFFEWLVITSHTHNLISFNLHIRDS